MIIQVFLHEGEQENTREVWGWDPSSHSNQAADYNFFYR